MVLLQSQTKISNQSGQRIVHFMQHQTQITNIQMTDIDTSIFQYKPNSVCGNPFLYVVATARVTKTVPARIANTIIANKEVKQRRQQLLFSARI